MQFANVSKSPILQSVSREDRTFLKSLTKALHSIGAVLPSNFDYRNGRHLIKTNERPMPLDELINKLVDSNPQLFDIPELQVDTNNYVYETFGLSGSEILECVKNTCSLAYTDLDVTASALSEILEHSAEINAFPSTQPVCISEEDDEDDDEVQDLRSDFVPVIDDTYIQNAELRSRLMLAFGTKYWHCQNPALARYEGNTFDLSQEHFNSISCGGDEDTIGVYTPSPDSNTITLPLYPPLTTSESVFGGLQVIIVPSDTQTPDNIQSIIDALMCYCVNVDNAILYFVNPDPTEEQRKLLTSIYKASITFARNTEALCFGSLGRSRRGAINNGFAPAITIDRDVYDQALDEDLDSEEFDSITCADAWYLQMSSIVLAVAVDSSIKDSTISVPRVRAVLRWLAEDQD